MLQLETGAIFLNSSENVRGPSATMDTSTAFHDYRIEIELADAGVAVFVDNVQALTGATFTEPTSVTDYLVWGEGSIAAHGRSEWQSFSHDAYGICRDGN